MSPQEYGRKIEKRLAEKYGWVSQPGSGNQYNRPSDALGGLALDTPFQIEIKVQPYRPESEKTEFHLPLAAVWEKLAGEAIMTGRIPILVVALSLEWVTAVCAYVDAEAWGIVDAQWPRETVTRYWTDDPTRWNRGAVIYTKVPSKRGVPKNLQLNALVPYWVRTPLERIPGLVGKTSH